MYVGLDLHKNYTEFAVMDIPGNLLRQGRIRNSLEQMKAPQSLGYATFS